MAALLAAGGAVLLRYSTPPRHVFHAPGQEWTQPGSGTATVRGQVIHDGAGVPGARVRLIPSQSRGRGRIVGPPVMLETRTDAEARFEIAGAPAGPARIAVLTDRHALSVTRLAIPSGQDSVEWTITLDAGVAMEGLVSAGASHIAGARVSVRMIGRDSDVERRPLREGVTDAEGRYRFAGLDPSKPLRLVVLAEGHRPFEKSLTSPMEAPGRIDLDPGLQMSGRIMTSSGEPVPDVEVAASQGEGYTASARSGTAGEVRIGGLIPRALTIRVLVEGFTPARLELPGPASGWTIHLKRTGGVAGQAPAGSWLVIESPGATYRRGVGDDGRFDWHGLPPGPAEARATDRAGRVLSSSRVEIPEGGVAGGILLMP